MYVALLAANACFRIVMEFILELIELWSFVISKHLSHGHRYISALLLSLSSMLHLELPHVNVLSKMDLVKLYGDLSKCLLVSAL